MKTDQEEDELLDSSPTDELPVLSELDIVEDFDRTSVFVSLQEDTGSYSTSRLHSVKNSVDPSGDTLSGTDTYRVHTSRADNRQEPATDSPARLHGASVDAEAHETAELASLRTRLDELTTLHTHLGTVIADRDASIASLEERLEATRQAVRRRDETEQRLQAQISDLQARLTEREDRLAERETRLLEADVRLTAAYSQLKERETGLGRAEARSTEFEARLKELEESLANRNAELIVRDSRLEALQSELFGREAEVREQSADLAARGAELAARDAELIGRDEQLEALTSQLAARDERIANLEAELADRNARMAENEAASAGDALRHSREDAAALAGYIENRRVHWDDMQRQLVEQRERMSELGVELEQRASREREAVQRAAAEAERVAELKTEVRNLRRLLDVRRRDTTPALPITTTPALPITTTPALPIPTTSARASDSSAPDRHLALDEGDTGIEPADDSQQQPAPQSRELDELRAELRELREELASRQAVTSEHGDGQEDLLQKLADSQAQLDHARQAVGRLERIVIERDRMLDVKNARIDSLQAELAEKLGAAAVASSPDGDRHDETAAQAKGLEDFSSNTGVASMVCLTDDAPRSYELRKPVVTIGRSSQCDIQIATHFVSREHARIMETADGPVIEDLESKNGVFVNSVRIERGPLQHGDLVTIGETQFRFLRE